MTDTDDRTIAALTTRLERLEERTRAVDAENARLRAAAAPNPAPPPTTRAAVDAPLGRRQAMRTGLALAGAAAAGAVLLDGKPAAADNGQPLLLGRANTATSVTTVTGSSLFVGAPGTALFAVGQGGASVQGRTFHLRFGNDFADRLPPMDENVVHEKGEVVFDRFSILWLCVASGTPGEWRSLGGNGGAGAFFPFPSPVRTYDSRPGTMPSQGPKTRLAAGATRTISLINTGLREPGGVLLNILLVNAAAGNGNFTVWSADRPIPSANTLVWGGSAGRFSTMAFSGVDEATRINVRASLSTDLVVDVVGAFR